METTRTAERVSFGRNLVALAVLATALAHGPLALAAPGDDDAVAAGCGTGAAPAAVAADPGVEWSSSPRMPGKPY